MQLWVSQSLTLYVICPQSGFSLQFDRRHIVSYNSLPAVSVMQGAGCGDVPPGPPVDLQAYPGDGKVTLQWKAPANGGCVTTYTVSAIPLTSGPVASQLSSQQTRYLQYTVDGLQNGVLYNFAVTAVATKYIRQAKSASVQARPRASAPTPNPPSDYSFCTTYVKPSGPANLRVVELRSTSAKLCWGM